MSKKYFSVFLLLSLCLLLWGCQSQTGQTDETEAIQEDASGEGEETPESEETEEAEKTASVLGGNIGILFPTEDDEEQVQEAEEIQGYLEEENYQTELLYAGGDGKTQADQLKQMVKDQKNCIIILPVSDEQLAKQLSKAAKKGITVISYDKLIGDTKDLSYYVGFDDYEIGSSIARHIVEEKKLDSAKSDRKTYTIEFFMGAVDDENQRQRFQGMIDVLQPYLESEVLVSKSLRLNFDDVSIATGSGEIAYQTCVNIMKANYMDAPVDIVVAGTDELAQEVMIALSEQKGFADQWPMVVGGEGSAAAFASIADGTEDMTVYCYEDQLPGLCAQLVDAVIQGDELKLSGTVNNGAADVDAIFGESKEVDADNYHQVMRDAGFSE